MWIQGRLLWPRGGVAPPTNPNLPKDIAKDYREASAIAHASPRGAAALLRLAAEKLCHPIVSADKTLNECIRILVAKGLDPHIQQALDYVRVIGNKAVHPGSVALQHDAHTIATLFSLVNLVAEHTITRPKKLQEMFDTLPADEKIKIAKRDGKGGQTSVPSTTPPEL